MRLKPIPKRKSATGELARRAFQAGVFLLPREDPETLQPLDAKRWVVVYQELVQFKTDLIGRIQQATAGFTPEAREEVSGTDLAAIQEQREHYERRLEFWQHRLWELQGLSLDAEASTISHRGRWARLTGRELALLKFFLDNAGRPYTARQLATHAWGKSEIFPEQVRTYISRLRARLREVEAPCRVVNIPRSGYRLDLDSGEGTFPT